MEKDTKENAKVDQAPSAKSELDSTYTGPLEVLYSIQQTLVAPKNEWNSYSNYKYRNVESILAEVKKAAKPYRSVVICTDEICMVGEWHYVKATVELITPYGTVSACAYAREQETEKGKNAGQITGSCSSYARKYALQGLFAVSRENDFNASSPTRNTNTANQNAAASRRFNAICRKCGYKGNNLSDRTVHTFKCPSCGAIDWDPTTTYGGKR